MAYTIDTVRLSRLLNERIAATLPDEWPGNMGYQTRSEGIAPHWDVDVYEPESSRPEDLVDELAHQIRLAFPGSQPGSRPASPPALRTTSGTRSPHCSSRRVGVPWKSLSSSAIPGRPSFSISTRTPSTKRRTRLGRRWCPASSEADARLRRSCEKVAITPPRPPRDSSAEIRDLQAVRLYGASRARTDDLHAASVALSQLSYSPRTVASISEPVRPAAAASADAGPSRAVRPAPRAPSPCRPRPPR